MNINGVKVDDNDIQIKSEKFIYYKTKRLLVLTGSVTIFDKSKNLFDLSKLKTTFFVGSPLPTKR